MAFTNSDGSIVLSTKVDTSGIKKGYDEALKFAEMNTNKQRSLAQSLSMVYRQQGMAQSEAQKQAWKDLKNGTVAAKDYEKALEDVEKKSKDFGKQSQKSGKQAKSAFDSVGNSLKALATQLALVFSAGKIISFSKDAASFATQTEASVQRLVDIYGSASQSVGDFIDANASALGMSRASAASFASVYGNLFSVWADQATNAELTNQYLQMTAVVASKTGRSVADVQERIRSGLLGNTEAIEDLGVFVNVKTIEMTDAFQRMANGKSWEQLDAYTQQQIRSMAILEQATAKYGNEVADTSATTRAQFQAAYEDFKNTWGQIINQVLIPVLQIATEVLRVITKGLQAIAQIGGATISEAQASAIGEAADNQNDLTKAVEETTKAQERSLAGFDKVNKLSESSSANASSSGAGATAGGGLGVSGTQPKMTSYAPQINKDLAELMSQIALALVAVGLILLLFGQIGWGIGFIIAGAFVFTVSQQAVSEGAIGEKIDKFLKENATLIAELSVAFIVFGVILLLAGQITPLSIGLIAFGAIGLVKEYMLNRTAIKAYLNNFFKENQKTFYKVGLAMCVLGIICLFSGVGIPLGIGLLLAGGVSLAAAISPNWGFIKEKLKEVWEGIKQFWNRHIAPVFTLAWWKNLGITIINGLIAGLEGGINLIIGGFEDMINLIVDGLNNLLSFELPDFLGGGGFSLDLPRADFPRVSLPRLARGAVIPPNKEFLAILGDQKHGTNIEAPLETIKQAVAEVVGGNSGKQPAIVNVYISSKRGLRLISQEVIADINETIATTGRVPINI